MASISRTKWDINARKAFVNTNYAILGATIGKLDTTNNGTLVIPYVDVNSGIQEDATEVVFSPADTSTVTIDTSKILKKGTAVKFTAIESTDVSLLPMIASGVGAYMKGQLALKICNGIIDGAGTKVKFATADATATGAGAAGELTFAMFVYAMTALSNAHCPKTDRYVLINPNQYGQLLTMEDANSKTVFMSNELLGREAIAEGSVGKCAGFEVIEMADISLVDEAGGDISSTPAENVRQCATFFHKAGYGWGAQENITNKSEDNLTLEQVEMLSRTKYGHKPLKASYIVQIRENNAS